MNEPSTNARLSKLLFEAREIVSMYADIVEIRIRRDEWLDRVIAEIDAYRAEQGWSPHGFGGEDGQGPATQPPLVPRETP